MNFNNIFFVLLSLFSIASACGQQRYNVFTFDSQSKNKISSPLKVNEHADSIMIIKNAIDVVNNWRLSGLVFSNVDSVRFLGKQCEIYFYKSPKYQLQLVEVDTDTKNIIDIAGINYNLNRLDSVTIRNNLKATLAYLNNNGYPFASVKFDNIKVTEYNIQANLKINKGQFIKFAPIMYKGRLRLNNKYLHRYLNILPKAPYNHNAVLSIPSQLSNIPFIQIDSFKGINFINEKAELDLYLSSKKANYFDFIIGVQPTTNSIGRKYSINGEINADVNNVFNQGENIRFRFKRLSLEDQELILSLDYPYIAGLPIGATGLFSLKRNFNASVDAITQIGLQYIFTGNNVLKAYWTNTSSRLTEIDSITLFNTKRLPSTLDYNYTGIGLNSTYRNLDYRFNPKKGYEINVNAIVGLKSIIQNQSIITLRNSDIDFSNAYDTLPDDPFQFDISTDISYYLSVNKWSTIKVNNRLGYKFINGVVLQNEVFRLGGNKSLRGFDELSVFTDAYTMVTLEYRIMLDKNSYLSLPFLDYFRGRTTADGKFKTGLGLGMGMNFSTAAGIFNLSFAAGNNYKGSPNFGNTKLHFGYVNLF
jgi:outer membrane translocation and assembly module TamA